jgi:hypothetical protein
MKDVVDLTPLDQQKSSHASVQAYADKFSSAPGIFTIFTHFPQLVDSIMNLVKSVKTKNKELIIQNAINVTKLPLGIIADLFKIMQFLSIIFVGVFIATEYLSLCVASLLFLLIGLGLEIYNLVEAVLFKKRYNIHGVNQIIKKIDKSGLQIKEFIESNKKDLLKAGLQQDVLNRIENFLNLKSNLSLKVITDIHKDLLDNSKKQKTIQDLIKTTGRTFTVEFITSLKKDAPHTTSVQSQESLLLERLNQQIKKSYIVHVVGILAIFTSALTITLSLITCPPVGVLAAGASAGLLESLRSVAYDGFIDQRGYRFDPLAFLPSCLTKRKPAKVIRLEIPELSLENLEASN